MNFFGKKEDTHKAIPMPANLQNGDKVLIITADNTEDTEFFYPYYRLTEAGYAVDVATPEGGAFEARHGLGLQETKPIKDINPDDYVLVYIPGGKAPAELRKNEKVLDVVRWFQRTGKPIAAICHGPQVLISAGLARNKRIACWPEVASELKEAGGIFVDEPLVEDGQFITGRRPSDLPQHLAGVLRYLNGSQGSVKSAA